MRHWRAGAALLLIGVVLCGLCGCGGERALSDGNDTQTASETLPESGIKMSDLSGYRIVRPEEASEAVVSAVIDFRAAFTEASGQQLELATDFYREGVPGLIIADREILIGKTNRPETETFLRTLLRNDYGYGIVNDKLVIAGHTDANTRLALTLFCENVLGGYGAENEYFLRQSDCVTVKAEYPVYEMTLCGVEIGKYTIAYAGENKNYEKPLAEVLADRLADLSGYMLPVKKADALIVENPGAVIYVGEPALSASDGLKQTCAVGEYLLAADGETVVAKGVDSLGNTAAVQALLALLTPADGKTTVRAELGEAKPTAYEDKMMSAMSFNVFVGNVTDERKARVLNVIESYMPDTFGVQEASLEWMNFLQSKLGGYYACVGSSRDGGTTGEYSAVFYAKDKFELIEKDTFWLSDTPDVVSKFEASSLNRICTYALLERKSDGARFMHLNTHYDHKSNEARLKQAEVMLEFVEKYPDTAIVCTGDFNAEKGGDVYRKIVSANTRLSDSAELASETEEKATFHNYGKASTIIDYCFVTNDRILVDRYHVCDELVEGDYPSDHHPVYIEYQLIG